LLIEKGAKVTAKDNFNLTPLHFAANNGNQVIVQQLLKKGADVTAQTLSGDTALHMAYRKGHKEVMQLLIKGGADVTAITPPIAPRASQLQNRPPPAAAKTPALQTRPPPPPTSNKNTISNSPVRRTCGLCLGYLDYEPGSTEMCLCAGS
jgi:ankyrin repeat protein